MKENGRYKRIVIKIGTSVITTEDNRLDRNRIKGIAAQAAELLDGGVEVIIVTSGAIGAGMGILKKGVRPQSLPELQACAAVGQSRLMKLYEEFFRKKGYAAAQMLVTQEDLTDRKRYLNVKNTLWTLLKQRVVPVINENDTVSTDEIRFGDNDRLSSLVANLAEADLLVMLTSVEGLCALDREGKRGIRCISVVEKITKEIEGFAVAQKSRLGVGGMVTKLQAAKIATSSGIPCVIANGAKKGVILKIINREKEGTFFSASRDAISAKKHWIAYTSKAQGAIRVDSGAKDALVHKQKSLLSSGVADIEGNFDVGDVVSIADEKNEEFAKGLTNFSSFELKKIKGLRTCQIREALGYKYYDEVVHRDNLVIL